MIKTKYVLNYTLQTGRDLFDDFETLDQQEARYQLGKDNTLGRVLSEILEGLDLAGYVVDDDSDISEILKPTTQEDDDDDFVMVRDLETRAMFRTEKKQAEQVLRAFIATKHINDQLLLEAPFDVAVEMFNKAMKDLTHKKKG